MLILKAVSLGPLHGYGVLLRIQQISAGQLEIQQGSLYPALYRLEHQGWIASEWGESENNRKAKFYSLTAAGRKQLRAKSEKWKRMARLRSWGRAMTRRSQLEGEMQAELQFHIESYADDLMRSGVSREEAL